MKTKIILEAGVNHNGSMKRAKKMIDLAKDAGADYVKFQSFVTDELVIEGASLAKYQKNNLKKKISQYQMLKKLELNTENTNILLKYCKKKNIKFLSSVFGIKSFHILHSLGVKKIKIPSGEINNIPLLKHISKFKKEIILSTGMANMKEVSQAVNVLSQNKISKKQITVMHCNTDYPTKIEDVNLNTMVEMGKKLKVKIGYSDHTNSTLVPIVAAAMGALYIEKHFTISKKLIGPDHKASLESKDLRKLINDVKIVNKIRGNSIKKPTKSEKINIKIVRKSLYAKEEIKIGEKFTNNNLKICRPALGLSPKNYYKFIGKKSERNFKKNQLIK